MSMPTKKDLPPCWFCIDQSLAKGRVGTRIGPRLDDPSLAISQQPPACWAGGSSCEYGTLFDRLVWKAADTVDSQSASFYLQQKVNPGFAIEKAGVNYISPELPPSFHHLVGSSCWCYPSSDSHFRWLWGHILFCGGVVWHFQPGSRKSLPFHCWQSTNRMRLQNAQLQKELLQSKGDWGVPQQAASGKVDSQRHSLLILGKAKTKNIF